MKTIFVFPIISQNDYPTAGSIIYDAIMRDIDSTDRIILDMNGVSLIPSMFLNMSIGRIIQDRGVSFVKNKLSFSNIQTSDANRIKEYVGRFS